MAHINIICEYATINGGENSLLALIPELQRRGITFSALAPKVETSTNASLEEAFQRHSIQLTQFEFISNGVRMPLPELRTQLRSRFSSAPSDIVWANSLSTSRIVGPVCRELGIPSLGYLRDIIKLNKQVVYDLNSIDRLVAVSNATRSFHIQQGLDPGRCVVIHNGVNHRHLEYEPNQNDIREELDLDQRTKLVLYVGQIGLRKGIDTWLDAAAEMAKSQNDIHFLLIGQRHSEKQESIDHERQLRAAAEHGKLAGRVHWLGRRTDVPQIMRQSDLLLHCARQEPLGRVLLEAFDAGLPAVATNVGGTPEIFCDEVLSGLMFPPGDSARAAKLVLRLMTDPELHQLVSNCQRQIALEKFSVDQAANMLADQLDQLVQL